MTSLRSDLDVLVVGGGAFGTTIAATLARLRLRLVLWVRRGEQVSEINTRHTNSRYLPGFELPVELVATDDLASCVPKAPLVIMAVPSQSFRQVARQVGDHLEGDQILVHGTKGFEIETFKRMSEILREETCALKTGVLSGPNLARELIGGQPAGALVASRFQEVIAKVQALFRSGPLRVYGGSDVIGTEVAAAFKNIVALAAGVADGLGYGDNTKALVVTRGLSEMARLGVALGADVFTFGGLAGIGDLMATCASALSRNHQVGERLAHGEALEDILSSMVNVAEGVPTTAAVHRRAQGMGLALPIVRAAHGLLFEHWTPLDAVAQLMALPTERELASLRYR